MTPMMHYLFNFVATTLFVVAMLYLVYLYVQRNPQVGQILTGAAKATGPAAAKGSLWIESVLDLEPRKRLYVVRHQQQRFLIATTMDKTEFLTTLESESPNAVSALDEASLTPSEAGVPEGPPISPQAGLMERFGYSLKMVLGERFTRPGGR